MTTLASPVTSALHTSLDLIFVITFYHYHQLLREGCVGLTTSVAKFTSQSSTPDHKGP